MSDKSDMSNEAPDQLSGQPSSQPQQEGSEYRSRLRGFWAAPTFAGLWELGQHGIHGSHVVIPRLC
ncbi:hypothetical protein F4776DRAFT_624771 [Hypoxylon sp. NC0597]|nr:hypothetical protein F4776DRAFT_624771 [Hypoxylon sp. NC0597]